MIPDDLMIWGDFNIIAKWYWVGRSLAYEQPEFKKRRGRGRPSLNNSGVDLQRAEVISTRRNESIAAGQKKPKDISLIEEFAREGHRLFPRIDNRTLAESVSRGNQVLAKRMVESELFRKELAALQMAEKERKSRWQEKENARCEESERKPNDDLSLRAGNMFAPLNSSGAAPGKNSR